MIDPATSWFEIVKLPTVKTTVPPAGIGKKVTFAKNTKVANYFDKSSTQISNLSKLVYKTWFSRYPHCKYKIYDNGSEFKLQF
jgi:hypothetical protein